MIESSPAGFFDLILMDLTMPVMDWIKATEHIRSLNDSIKANIPVIAMTANVSDMDRKAAFDAGMNAHVAKPIDIKNMEKVIKEVLTNAQK
jgi:CheY-like chemotaxis protein